jgi:hypothetical protein
MPTKNRRMTITIPPSMPELLADLDRFSKRDQAARLRSLAWSAVRGVVIPVGSQSPLSAPQGSLPVVMPAPTPTPTHVHIAPASSARARVAKLKAGLMGSNGDGV